MQEQPTLFLLDGMALVFRAHFAFANAPRITSQGLNTSAIFGFCNSLLEVIQKESPTHIAVAFDSHEPTFRHEQNEDYKANRADTPTEILAAIPYIHEILKAMAIPELRLPGYEADDIIGTFAKKAEKEGLKVFMMTPDKDFCQLVSENIFCYRPARLGNGVEILDIEGVKEKFGVPPEQVADVLGLWGDAVDNIKGIPGIGEKTAKKLIQEYGSVENLIQNAHQLKGKIKENVINFAQQGLESKQLATIHINVPLDFVLEDLKLSPFDKEALKTIFEELEFKTLAKRLFSEEKPVVQAQNQQLDLFGNPVETSTSTQKTTNSSQAFVMVPTSKTIETVAHTYTTINTEIALKELVAHLSTLPDFCFDTETTSTDTHTCDLVGISFSAKAFEGYYVPCNGDLSKTIILNIVKPLLENPHIRKVGHNLKFDMEVLHWQGIEVKGELFDTMLANYVIQPEMKHGMDALAEVYFNYTPISIQTLIGKGQKQLSMADVAIDKVSEYAAEDADITWQLYEKLRSDVVSKEVEALFKEVEMPLMPVLADMEICGVCIDVDFLNEYAKQLEQEIISLDAEIQKLAQVKFNVNSPKQLGEVLFDVLKLDKGTKTKSGQYSTGEEILEKLAVKLDLEATEKGVESINIPRKVLEYRQLAKLKSTYVDALPALLNTNTKRIHTSFNQAVAVTGRLSSNNPNLQNIPIRTDKGREVRKAFIAKDAQHCILSADYSQIELRIMASVSEDEGMMTAFNNNEDIHTATAAKVFGVAIEDVTSDMRRKAKMVNFGIIYGISAHGLAERLAIPRKEAAQIIENYFTQYPKVKLYMDSVINQARELGYVKTLLGRKRFLSEIHSNTPTIRSFAERNAINAPIQGSAADMIKIAMINLHQKLKGYQTKMMLQVHDELLFEVPLSELELVKPIIEKEMREALALKVPIEVGIGIGNNWLDAH